MAQTYFSHDSLQAFLRRVSRPIEFASRQADAHLATVKNLDRFVSDQVIEALGERVYPRAIETDLLVLRSLFVGFHTGLSSHEQRDRLARALVLLRRLRNDPGGPQNTSPSSEQASSPSASRPVTGRPLWDLPIQFAKGVGPKRASLLERLGISTVEQALWALPWRYEDRSVMTPIGKLTPGHTHTISGVMREAKLTRARARRLSILDVVVEDETGNVSVVFFNQPYLVDVFRQGERIMVTGRVTAGRGGWMDVRLEPTQFEVLSGVEDELLHVGRIVPVYHETKGWTSRQMRALLHGLLLEYGPDVEEVVPLPIRARHRLMPIRTALQQVHFPPSETGAAELDLGATPAHRRLAFEELFVLQTALALRQRETTKEVKAFRINPHVDELRELTRRLPFKLTSAQERVFGDIQGDMVSSRPMNRLVQGDVGSGKTVVALHALVMAGGSGCQTALMVPTEILAEQHYLNLRPLLETVGLKTVLLTSGGRAKERTEMLKQLATGAAHVAIGTHALIQKDVRFSKLGLVIVDEQHKFGVLQRKTLLDKGYRPDVLVMTATPIPRTLAMTVYGDLDVSIIDMLPPGRKPIRTLLYSEGQRHKAWQLVGDETKAGRQAYIVYPLIEESEKVDLKAAIQGAEHLQRDVFPHARVGLLHGRLKAVEKERIMAGFKSGTIHILVATTVIEVGVDVPNASIMVIEHAERFGLAQLHQLRGRVGRGAHQSLCLLMASYLPREKRSRIGPGGTCDETASDAQRRLSALVKSNDGFLIAEEDLRIRGPGEFLGFRQWGAPEFRAANLLRDADLLAQARQEAFALVEQDPGLIRPQHHSLKGALFRRWHSKLALGSVS